MTAGPQNKLHYSKSRNLDSKKRRCWCPDMFFNLIFVVFFVLSVIFFFFKSPSNFFLKKTKKSILVPFTSSGLRWHVTLLQQGLACLLLSFIMNLYCLINPHFARLQRERWGSSASLPHFLSLSFFGCFKWPFAYILFHNFRSFSLDSLLLYNCKNVFTEVY